MQSIGDGSRHPTTAVSSQVDLTDGLISKTGWMGVIVGGSGWGVAGTMPPGDRGDCGLFMLLTSINGRTPLGEGWRPTGEAAGLGGLMLRAETGAA